MNGLIIFNKTIFRLNDPSWYVRSEHRLAYNAQHTKISIIIYDNSRKSKPKHFSYTLFTFPFSSSEFQWCFKRLSFFSTWSPAGDPAKHGESLICKRVRKNNQEMENDKGPSRNKCFVDTLTCDFYCPKLMLLSNSRKWRLNSIN